MATREELSAIDQALGSINDRVRDISVSQQDIDLGGRFRDAAEQAAAVFTTDRIGAFKGAIKDAGKAITLFAKQIKEAKTSTLAMNGAFMGFLGGFGLAKTSLSLFGGLLSSVFNIGRSVVGAFTNTIGSLFGFFYGALKSGGGGSGLFELLQEMRTSFGGLEDYSNQAIFSIADNLRALPRRLNIVGWSFTKLIENAKKYADTLGPLFMDFARYQFTPATALLLHGMGATEEQQVDLVRSSRAMGVSLNDMMMDIARNGAAVGQAIGESAKVIQKEMLAARQNIQVFGSVTDEELSLTVGRLRTLGMEAKDVANIFNAFDTFQGAAEAASKLAAAFGMQIDVFRMVNEENPASRLDMLRNEMFKTGRSAEQLSRRELMLFSNILGESDLRLVQMALSAENAGMSMEDIAKAAEESGEKTKPLEEVLSDLSNQIARMVGSGGSYDTFLGAMNYGIERGIKRWMWMNQLTFSYRRALHETAWGFRRLAYQFMQYFPGIRDVAKGFVDLFNPRRIREFFRTLTGSTFDYLDGSGGKDGLIYRFLSTDNFDPKGFFDNVLGAIMDWAGPNGAVVMNIMNGLKTIGNAILIGIKELLAWVSEKIFGDPVNGLAAMMVTGFRDALRFLVNFMTADSIEAALSGAGDFAGGFFEGFITPIVNFFKTPAVQEMLKEILDLLGQAFMRVLEMADNIWRRITGAIATALMGSWSSLVVGPDGLGPGMMTTLVAMMFAPAAIGAIASVALKGALNLGGVLGSVISGGVSRAAGPQVSGVLPGIMGGGAAGGVLGGGGGGRSPSALSSIARSVATSVVIGQITQRASKLSISGIVKGGLAIAAVAAMLAGIGYLLVKGLNDIPIQPGLVAKAGAFAILLTSMLPGIIAASLIGLGGPAFAGAVALGGAVVASFVGIMGIITTNFLGDLNALEISDNTLGVLRVLPMFFAGIAAVAIAVSASALLAIIPGTVGRAEKILQATMDFMSSASAQVVDLANVIRNMISNLGEGELTRIERGFELFIDLFGTVVSVLPAMGSLMQSTRAGLFRSQEVRNEGVAMIFDKVNSLMESLFGGDSVVTKLVSNIRNTGISSADLDTIEALGPLLSLVTSVIQISTEYGGRLIDATAGGRDESITPAQIDLINRGVIGLAGAIFSIFSSGVPNAIRSVINSLRGLQMPEGGSEMLSSVSSLLGAVFGFIGPVSELLRSPRLTATLAALEAGRGTIGWVASGALEDLSDKAPSIISIANSIGIIIEKMQEPIGDLIGIVKTQAASIENPEEFASQSESILKIITSIGEVMDIAQQFSELPENSLAITPDGIGLFTVANMQNITNIIGRTVGYFAGNPQLNRISEASTKIEQLNTEFMPKLKQFFENSGEVVSAIEASGVVRLEQSLQAGLRELLPAAVAAIETSGAEITSGDVSVALAGTTFNISVILEIDGEELAEVTARNLNKR